jgi:hypothetical protein
MVVTLNSKARSINVSCETSIEEGNGGGGCGAGGEKTNVTVLGSRSFGVFDTF